MERLSWVLIGLGFGLLLLVVYRICYAIVLGRVFAEYYRRADQEEEGDAEVHVFFGGLFPRLIWVFPDERSSIKEGLLWDVEAHRGIRTASMSDALYLRLIG